MYATWTLSASCLYEAGFSGSWCLESSARHLIPHEDYGVVVVKALIPWGPREAPPSSSMCMMWGMSWFSSRVWCLQFPYWRSELTAGSPCRAYCCSLLLSNILISTYTHLYMYTFLRCWRKAGHWTFGWVKCKGQMCKMFCTSFIIVVWSCVWPCVYTAVD